jgi:hypothetical protein
MLHLNNVMHALINVLKMDASMYDLYMNVILTALPLLKRLGVSYSY